MKTHLHYITIALATTSALIMLEPDWLNTRALPLSFRLPALTAPAFAKSNLRYVPPQFPKRRTLTQTQGAASRGTSEISVSLMLLAPDEHTGRTVSGHPSFFWYVSHIPSTPLQFTLVDAENQRSIWVQQVQVRRSGIIKLEMPPDLPALTSGKQYTWSVTLLSADRSSQNQSLYQAAIERIAMTPTQLKQLAAATSDSDRARIYARAGFWYDALDAIATRYLANPDDLDLLTDLTTLLNQIGLAQVLD